MKILIGSARSDERKAYSGGMPGDQRQSSSPDMSGEVSQQPFYVHKKGWNILRAKDPEIAEKLGDTIIRACNNPNVGYSQSDNCGILKYGTNSSVPCNSDCSKLVRECVKESSGKDPGDFTTSNEVSVLFNTGLFAKMAYTPDTPLYKGDILVTRSKGHTVIVTEGRSRITKEKPPRSFGIDVAKWQGDIDWAKVKRSGHGDFAVLKVTKKDNSPEEAFERNFIGCKEQCIPIAVYRYVYAKSVKQAVLEANGIIAALDGKVIEGEVWLDMEDDSIRNIGKAALTLLIDTMADLLKGHGYRVGIYCNRDWYDNVLDSRELSKRYNFWIAKYGKNNGEWRGRSDSPCDIAAAWQYTSKGKVDGIQGDVDLDLIF